MHVRLSFKRSKLGVYNLVVTFPCMTRAAMFGHSRDRAHEGLVDVELTKRKIVVTPNPGGERRVGGCGMNANRRDRALESSAMLTLKARVWLDPRGDVTSRLVPAQVEPDGRVTVYIPSDWVTDGVGEVNVAAQQRQAAPDPMELVRAMTPLTPRVYKSTPSTPRVPPRAREGKPWVDPAPLEPGYMSSHPGVPVGLPGKPVIFPGDPPPGRSALDQGYFGGSGLAERRK